MNYPEPHENLPKPTNDLHVLDILNDLNQLLVLNGYDRACLKIHNEFLEK